MKNQLKFENYILRNGTNVTNEKLQGLLFFSLISICRRGLARTLDRVVMVKDNYVLIKGSFERYQKYGEEVIPIPNYDMRITIVNEAHLDAILKTYDRFDGKQLTQLIRDTGLLEKCDNDYLDMKSFWSYYKALIKKNRKINRERNIYQNNYFSKFNIIRVIYTVFALLIILLIFITLRYEGRRADLGIFATLNFFNAFYIFYSQTIHRTIEFTAFMRVEKYKLENHNLGEVQ